MRVRVCVGARGVKVNCQCVRAEKFIHAMCIYIICTCVEIFITSVAIDVKVLLDINIQIYIIRKN